jgi:(p)ppGpp synthase/HD superfamily hydrolase
MFKEWREGLSEKAIEFAREKHSGQKRKSGEEYITHPQAVQQIMREEWKIKDEALLAAAALHDVPEDTGVTLEDVEKKFGKEVRDLVDGVTAMTLDEDTERKGARAAYADERVLMLKLADRLHNMRTLQAMPVDKAKRKAQETLKVYVPMAEAVGMWRVKSELEDLSFQYVNPEEYERFKEIVEGDGRLDAEFLRNITSTIEQIARVANIDVKVAVEKSGLWRLERIAVKQGLTSPDGKMDLSRINDFVSVRATVSDKAGWDGAYTLLGRVHAHFGAAVDMERFDDFGPGNVRPNGYSALQTTVETLRGAVEIAVVPKTAERFNDWGLVMGLQENGPVVLPQHDKVKYIFTPDGDVRWLPQGATGWDLAYQLFPGLGASAVGMIVEGRGEPMSMVLPNAASVYVIAEGVRTEPRPGAEDFGNSTTRRLIEMQRELARRRLAAVEGEEKVDAWLAERHLPDLDWLADKGLLPVLQGLGVADVQMLCLRVGSGLSPGLLDELGSALEKAGINSASLGVSALRVKGEDKPGILAAMSALIGQQGGNVEKLLSISDKKTRTFKVTAIISGLGEEGEEAIEKFLEEQGLKGTI